LANATTLETPSLQLTAWALKSITADGHLGIAVVYGDAGLGKTFAVHCALCDHEDMRPLVVEFQPKATVASTAHTLYKKLHGEEYSGVTRRALEECARALSGDPRLLVIDEAQRLTSEAIEVLRALHDRDDTNFALLLVGGHRCWEVLTSNPMLESRVAPRIAFRPMSDDEVVAAIPSYHPLYRTASEALVRYIDDYWAHGVWRNWAIFTLLADALCAERDRQLDEQVVNNIFHGLGR
jgi:DNA transposition AAA+ family ATPase